MEPVFSITAEMLETAMDIARKEERLRQKIDRPDLKLRKTVTMDSVSATVRIEQNTLSEDEIRDCVNGIEVTGPENDIKAVRNAWNAYNAIDGFSPFSSSSLLRAHGIMMKDIITECGTWRKGNVGVADAEGNIIHMGALPHLIPSLIDHLLTWTEKAPFNMLIKSAAFHAEFEMIHPFRDGNGRIGRLWHSLLLSKHDPIYSLLPIETMILRKQEEYYHALRITSITGDSSSFISFMLEIIDDSLTERLASVAKEEAPVHMPSQQEVIFSWLESHDSIRNEDVRKLCSVSSATASRILKSLTDEGKLIRYKDGTVWAYVSRPGSVKP